jgi:hypothetical protein
MFKYYFLNMNLKQIYESNDFSKWKIKVYKLKLFYWNNISLFKFNILKLYY